MTVTADALRRVPLFAGMTDRAVELISETLSEAEWPAGTVLVRQGDPGDSFLVLAEGSARVERDGRPVAVLDRGAFLGEIALIDATPRTATVTAKTDVRVLRMERRDFLRLIDEHRAVRYALLTALTERLRALAPSEVA